jgi:hypothetical protein
VLGKDSGYTLVFHMRISQFDGKHASD